MIPQLIMVFPFLVPFLFSLFEDPLPGLVRSKAAARTVECLPISRENAEAARPGTVREKAPRGDFYEDAFMACESAVFLPGLRPASTEALLNGLDDSAQRIAAAATAAFPDAKRWFVETDFPDAALARKIGSALKNALLLQRAQVAEAAPLRAEADIIALRSTGPLKRMSTACDYARNGGTLERGTALLGATLVNPAETVLHAGICAEGGWTWLL